MQLVTSTTVESGQYFSGMHLARANDQAYDAEARARLRRISREMTDLE
jgi:hypothetical protein